ncbi:MAG: tRNA pseudouridine(38-40) synthase TruA [Candidatus Hydrogenedentes bacterium]|nr:tRNA pseudouridine(38-40) synthase TruA [Candidatus Hydrogenedentota bacterium]
MNIKAKVRYDGSGFAGWQVQPGLRTVQGELERVLSTIASQPVRVRAAGRTDAGVHALGQVCNFQWPQEPDTERLRRSISGMLSPDLRAESVEVVPDEFDARFSATAKRYAYAFSLSKFPDPFTARYAWLVPWRIDLHLLTELAGRITGRRDFAGFQCAGASSATTVRTLHSVALIEGGFAGPVDAAGLWRLEFRGDAFLYKMVRNLAGTMIDIARGQLAASVLDERLGSPGPYRGHTAPAHGLALMEVEY